MHELSVCQGIISQVEQIATRHQASAVSLIKLQIGPLSGVEPQLLENAFSIAAAGSVAEQAKLHIDSLPVRVRCSQCGSESDASPNRLLCASCGDWRTLLISGDEMLLASVELVTAEH